MKVVVAMSGGVDSSTAAGLLVEAGHEVIGVAMKTHAETPGEVAGVARACCTPSDLRDARAVADHLNIPFYVLNYTEVFRRQIIVPFAEAYRRGETPNPCIDCNDRIKFRPLLERARLLGADRLATGHYARIEQGPGGRRRLHRGRDVNKDQGYFLYRLDQEQLARLWFPLGEMTKPEVRAEARRLGVPVAEKSESQEICFAGAEGYAAVVESHVGPGEPGEIVDRAGRVLGEHRGVHHFTLGQRRGLGIAAREPLYVIEIDAARHLVRVGSPADLLTDRVTAANPTWVGEPPAAGEAVSVQQRYREKARPGLLSDIGPHRFSVVFDPPVPRGAPGQAAVLYRGDELLGGGVVVAPRPLGAPRTAPPDRPVSTPEARP